MQNIKITFLKDPVIDYITWNDLLRFRFHFEYHHVIGFSSLHLIQSDDLPITYHDVLQ